MWVRRRRRPRPGLAEETENSCCNMFGGIWRNSDFTIGRLLIGPPFQFSVSLNPAEDRFLIKFLQQTLGQGNQSSLTWACLLRE